MTSTAINTDWRNGRDYYLYWRKHVAAPGSGIKVPRRDIVAIARRLDLACNHVEACIDTYLWD